MFARILFVIVFFLTPTAFATDMCQTLFSNQTSKTILLMIDNEKNDLIFASNPTRHGFGLLRNNLLCLTDQKIIAAVGDNTHRQWFITRIVYNNHNKQLLLQFPKDFDEYNPINPPKINQ